MQLLDDESVRDVYVRRKKKKLNLTHETSTVELYAHINKSLHEAAGEALGQFEKSPSKEWWSEEVAERLYKKKVLFHKWLGSENQEDWKEYRKMNTQLKRGVGDSKNHASEAGFRSIDCTVGYIGYRRWLIKVTSTFFK